MDVFSEASSSDLRAHLTIVAVAIYAMSSKFLHLKILVDQHGASEWLEFRDRMRVVYDQSYSHKLSPPGTEAPIVLSTDNRFVLVPKD